MLQDDAKDTLAFQLIKYKDDCDFYFDFVLQSLRRQERKCFVEGKLRRRRSCTCVNVGPGTEDEAQRKSRLEAFMIMGDVSQIPDAALQEYRNELPTDADRRGVPTIKGRRAVRKDSDEIEWESWTDSGEIDAAWYQPNYVLLRVANCCPLPACDRFAGQCYVYRRTKHFAAGRQS